MRGGRDRELGRERWKNDEKKKCWERAKESQKDSAVMRNTT